MPSFRQIELMCHTLGGKNPKKWYRNHFVADEKHFDYDNLCSLEKEGLMSRSETPVFCNQDDIVFQVTEEGQIALEMLFLCK